MKRVVILFVSLLLLVTGLAADHFLASTPPTSQRPQVSSALSPLGAGTSAINTQKSSQGKQQKLVPEVGTPQHSDTSPALRSIPARVTRLPKAPKPAITSVWATTPIPLTL